MKGMILLADFFEDTEAIATIDVIRRSGLQIDLISLGEKKEVSSAYQIQMKADYTLDEVELKEYQFLIIPGGGHAVNAMHQDQRISNVILHFHHQNNLIAAICAAPSLLTKLGILDNKKFTCYPTFERDERQAIFVDAGVVVEDHFITAKSMAYSIEFGLSIVEYLINKNTSENIKRAVFAEIN